jgi:hypothetical protein
MQFRLICGSLGKQFDVSTTDIQDLLQDHSSEKTVKICKVNSSSELLWLKLSRLRWNGQRLYALSERHFGGSRICGVFLLPLSSEE